MIAQVTEATKWFGERSLLPIATGAAVCALGGDWSSKTVSTTLSCVAAGIGTSLLTETVLKSLPTKGEAKLHHEQIVGTKWWKATPLLKPVAVSGIGVAALVSITLPVDTNILSREIVPGMIIGLGLMGTTLGLTNLGADSLIARGVRGIGNQEIASRTGRAVIAGIALSFLENFADSVEGKDLSLGSRIVWNAGLGTALALGTAFIRKKEKTGQIAGNILGAITTLCLAIDRLDRRKFISDALLLASPLFTHKIQEDKRKEAALLAFILLTAANAFETSSPHLFMNNYKHLAIRLSIGTFIYATALATEGMAKRVLHKRLPRNMPLG